jgi:hypothetical protein
MKHVRIRSWDDKLSDLYPRWKNFRIRDPYKKSHIRNTEFKFRFQLKIL